MSVRFWVLMLVAVFFFGIISGIYLTWDRGEKLKSGRNKTAASEPLLPKERVDISAERIELAQGSGGAMEWSLSAGRGEYDQQNRLVVISDPDVTYYMGIERKPVRVRGKKGSVSQETGGIRMWDGVLVDFDNLSINATELEYFSSNKTLRLDQGVTMERAGLSANATTVIMDMTTRDVQVTGPIQALMAQSYLGLGNATRRDGNATTAAPGNATGNEMGNTLDLDRATRLTPSGTGQAPDAPLTPPPARKAKRPAHRRAG